MNSAKKEKIKCLQNYFKYGYKNYNEQCMKNFDLEYEKNMLQVITDWTRCIEKINPTVYIDYTYRVDIRCTEPRIVFLNKLSEASANGSLAEEIMFIVCPELIVSRFLIAIVGSDELLSFKGVHVHSAYEGTAESFKCIGVPSYISIVSTFQAILIAASDFSNDELSQYSKDSVEEELNKAMVAYSACKWDIVVSGNWGGANLKGDPVLKAKIQVIAATEAKRQVHYYTLKEPGLADKLNSPLKKPVKKSTTGKEYDALIKWCNKQKMKKEKQMTSGNRACNFSVPEQQNYRALKVSIGKCFQSGFGSSLQVANFIRYTSLCANDGDDGLNNLDLLVEVLDNMRGSCFLLTKILPAMQDIVKYSGTVLDKFSLSSDDRSTATLTRLEILSLLSCSFFCCFPKSSYDKGRLLNFSQLYQKECGSYHNNIVKMEKIKCLLHYFEFAVSHFYDAIMFGVVTFKRRFVRKPLDWANSSMNICNLKVIDAKKAPDDTRTRVDFAHSNIGGGVLSNGSLQEEILFITCPELIASRFFSSKMENNEAIIIDGVYQYSQYQGYADSFTCAGACPAVGNMSNTLEVAAMDAINFSNNELMQYSRRAVDRELTKAYAAFSAVSGRVIASGNWGGGCFKGDPVLKAKIQMIAASEAGKEVQYVTFQTTGLANKIKYQVNHENCSYTVAKEYEELMRWCSRKSSRIALKMSSHTTTTSFKLTHNA
ncbi:Hypothetical predicted protein [Cloeon dipterum]|uniref:poly(ADP-ribose) glycohydrolase n=1 Tax=Cloeon dipterum TaxID=197152 RepID=A0A8S1DXU4_9INSE|nr:Hypothetical predicted protein [Cloeon dipterum]